MNKVIHLGLELFDKDDRTIEGEFEIHYYLDRDGIVQIESVYVDGKDVTERLELYDIKQEVEDCLASQEEDY
tara:strand:+ start:1348 stop:1563 length:216 start_codon:yes stop_codon:yes gene_type:complete